VNRTTTAVADSLASVTWSSDSTTPERTHVVTVAGRVPVGKPGILFPYAVPEPSRFAEVVLTEALTKAGVRVDGRTIGPREQSSTTYPPSQIVAEHVSAPLAEELKVTLKVSQNLHASMMPRLLGALLAPGDSTRTGFDLERGFLERAGLDLDGASQGDGAGGDAHFSPAFMVSLLTYFAHQKDSAVFRGALPILGRDGTLWNIQPQSPAAGHVFAKTGTFVVDDPLHRGLMLTAKGLAGYLTTRYGRHLAFAVYVNNVALPSNPDAITQIAGQALGEIAAAAYEARTGGP
jgi:D-alanyl-D-alanine carboxypeptidase/D-alanyl-D-alanine-endopeptidase (penicillin-binding protein 4)